jgi:D-aminopeptidase
MFLRGIIIADLEGIEGIYSLSDVSQCKNLFNREIELILKVLNLNGVYDIVVCDIHNNGDFLDRTVVEKFGAMHCSKLWNITFEETFNFAMLVGFHGMKGSTGILAHTIRPEISSAFINGKEVGEIEIFSRWLGHKSIPVLLVSGDLAVVDEVNTFNNTRIYCVVKSRNMVDEFSFDNFALYNRNVPKALNLPHELCVSKDSDKLVLNFINADIAEYTELQEFICGANLVFENCTQFVDNLERVCLAIGSAFRKVQYENAIFISELSQKVKCIDRQKITSSKIQKFFLMDINLIDKNIRNIINDHIAMIINE